MKPNWRRSYIKYQGLMLRLVDNYRKRADLKAYLEIFLSLATISLFSLFALRPTLLTIAELIKEIDSKRQTLEKMETKIQDLSRAQILYDRESQNIKLLNEAVPQSPVPETLARQIEGLSQKNQLGISGFSVEQATILGTETPKKIDAEGEIEHPPDGSGEMAYGLTASASLSDYQTFINFLRDFENLRRPANIQRVNISLETAKEGENELKLSVNGSLPYLKIGVPDN